MAETVVLPPVLEHVVYELAMRHCFENNVPDDKVGQILSRHTRIAVQFIEAAQGAASVILPGGAKLALADDGRLAVKFDA